MILGWCLMSEASKMIYLVPSFESDQQAWEILKRIYDQILKRLFSCEESIAGLMSSKSNRQKSKVLNGHIIFPLCNRTAI